MNNGTFLIPSQSQVVFLEKAQAANILTNQDEFIKSLSTFDRSSRLKTNQIFSTEDFLARISLETIDWEPAEINKIKKSVTSIQSKLQKPDLRFPDQIFLIKTSGNEEGNAAYCRGNSIILPQSYVSRNPSELEDLIIHELFHVYSRNNPVQKDKLYNLIGFRQCPELEFPQELQEIKITNPDAYSNNYYITITDRAKTLNVIPIIAADRNIEAIDGKEFFKYLKFDLLEVKIDNNQCLPVYSDNQLSLIAPNQSFYDQIGRNTNYIIHPEEILAENFVLLINQTKDLKSPFVIEGMKKILTDN